jgi:hypothetical protein
MHTAITSPEKKKQLMEFYKAMKMAAKIFPAKNQASKQNMIMQLADQIIEELKKDHPDEDKIQRLTEKIREISF